MAIHQQLRARLSARPGTPSSAAASRGLSRLEIEGQSALMFAPDARGPLPLLLLLHGATQAPDRLVAKAQRLAAELGVLILAPKSKGVTWDVIRGGEFGADVDFIDQALKTVFAGFPVDPARIAVGGFSDGASYALSLGLQNGDLFSDVLAFSAGFVVAPERRGRPRVFVSHGRDDEVLPIERCGRAIARDLAQAHYDVTYREFDGGHMLPPEVLEAAMRRFVGAGAAQA